MSDHGFGADVPPPPPPPPPPKDEGAGGAKDGADDPYEDTGGSPGQETAQEEAREDDESAKRSEDAAGDGDEAPDEDSTKPLPPSDGVAEDQGGLKDGADDPYDDVRRSPVQETTEAEVDGFEDNDQAENNDEAAAPASDADETRDEDTATDPPPSAGQSPSKDDAQAQPEQRPDAPADARQSDASTPQGERDDPSPSEPTDHIPAQRQDQTTRQEPDGETASVDDTTEAGAQGSQSAETVEDADEVQRGPEPEPVETDRSPEDPATAGTEQHTPHAQDAPQPSHGAGGPGPDHNAEPPSEPQVPEQPSEPQVPEQPGPLAQPEHSADSRPEHSGDPEGSVPGGSTDQLADPAVSTDAAGTEIDAGVEDLGKVAVATVEVAAVAGKVAAGLAMEVGAAASEAQADIKPDGGVAGGDNGGVRDEGGGPGEDAPDGDVQTGDQPPTGDQQESTGPEDGPEESDPVEPGDDTALTSPDDADGSDSPEPVRPTDRISEASSHLEDRKLTTDSGEAFYGPEDTEMRDMAAKLEPEEGAFTVDLHGTPRSVEVDGRNINAEELSTYLASDKSDWDGEPIRLMSCETGQGEEPFAQELSDNLGVPVTAPTELAWSDPQGNSWVASGVLDEYGDLHSTWPPDGKWVTFRPNDKS